jgi:polysaccharide export outer membrane protein
VSWVNRADVEGSVLARDLRAIDIKRTDILGFVRQIAAGALALGLASCELAPGSGPSRDSLIEAGTATEQNIDPPFTVVEVTPSAVSLLARRGGASLRGRFGDYRPPISPVIGVGDIVQVTIWEAASGGLFSSAVQGSVNAGSHAAPIPDQMVGRDGSITVPYGGRVQAAGRTPQQVEAAIVERLKGKAIEPQAIVNVMKNASSTVTVTGEVTTGARIPLSLRGDRVMDVIASAGGFRSSTHETFISLTRDGHTVRVPVQTLLADPRENIYVRPGDVLTVERTPQTFTVAGATGANAMIPFDARGLTLEEAVGKAGGLQDQRADPAGLFVMRYETSDLVREFPGVSPVLPRGAQTPVAYHLNMRDPSALFLARRFAMRDKDILFVSNAPITEIGKYFQMFQMVTSPLIQGAGMVYVAKGI